MEVNKYEDIMGVVVTEAIVEGRMVLLTSHSENLNYGSKTDLPGVKLPDSAADAAKARYCVAFAVDNTEPPIYEPYPTLGSFALRNGFSVDPNVPFSATIRLTPPSIQEGQTIASGFVALAFGAGAVITVPSGAYVYSASLVPGAYLDVTDPVSDAAEDPGKLKYSADASFAEVLGMNSDLDLTFRILY